MNSCLLWICYMSDNIVCGFVNIWIVVHGFVTWATILCMKLLLFDIDCGKKNVVNEFATHMDSCLWNC
jgi:hypothetical protein